LIQQIHDLIQKVSNRKSLIGRYLVTNIICTGCQSPTSACGE